MIFALCSAKVLQHVKLVHIVRLTVMRENLPNCKTAYHWRETNVLENNEGWSAIIVKLYGNIFISFSVLQIQMDIVR